MKNVLALILIIVVVALLCHGLNAQQVIVEKKSKIVTYKNQIIITKYMLIRNDSLSYKDKTGNICNINMKDIKSISVKEGTMFFTVMGICIASGLAIGIVPYLPSISGMGIGIGLLAGTIAGLIVAPFVQTPFTLVYYLNKWKIEKSELLILSLKFRQL